MPNAEDRPLVAVKLGGSLITDKTEVEAARPEVIRRLASEIAKAWPEMRHGLLLGHGSGSFGHVAAKQHGLRSFQAAVEAGGSRVDALGAAIVQRAAGALHTLMLDALLQAGVPAWSWPPSAGLHRPGGRPPAGGVGALAAAVESGFLPVLYGDVMADEERRASIVSTEAVFRHVVPRLRRHGLVVRRMLWLGETDGIYDASGKTIPRIDAENLERARRAVGGAAGTDVTGGMLLRLETAWQLARQGIESWVVDGRREGVLSRGLLGGEPPGGTRIVPPLSP